MELITLGIKRNEKGRLRSFGLFLCLHCLKTVERRIDNGVLAKSCGNVKCKENKGNYKHGEANTNLYSIWGTMKDRCLNPNNKRYNDWGGRGISICPEWTDKENGYINFRDWALNNGYAEGLQINRINNDDNYEPNNCNWVTSKENNQNKRKQKKWKITEEVAYKIKELKNTYSYSQYILAEMFNISQSNVSRILNKKIWCEK